MVRYPLRVSAVVVSLMRFRVRGLRQQVPSGLVLRLAAALGSAALVALGVLVLVSAVTARPWVFLTLDTDSPLLQTGLADDRFHVTDYMGDGGYPGHRAEKDEAEEYVAAIVGALGRGEAPELATELRHYLRAMFPPEELQEAEGQLVHRYA